ncbi:MAG TPA: hypothetical protein VK442_04750, partial [Xanthobacteraceae bacterium]|nr:hypothetical protein [Xanthobacteraceae bacterium]
DRMRADIHDGPEKPLQPKAGYIDARPQSNNSIKTLATHGRTIQLGQDRPIPGVRFMSDPPPITSRIATKKLRVMRKGLRVIGFVSRYEKLP